MKIIVLFIYSLKCHPTPNDHNTPKQFKGSKTEINKNRTRLEQEKKEEQNDIPGKPQKHPTSNWLPTKGEPTTVAQDLWNTNCWCQGNQGLINLAALN